MCARAQHVPCAPQTKFLYGVVMPMSSCVSVTRLVSLAQKFTSSEDPKFKKLYPSGTCRLCHSSPLTTKEQAHPWWLSAHKVSAQSGHWFDLQHWLDFFARVGTLHVPPIALRLAPSSFRCSGASNGAYPVTIGPAVRAPGAKMLAQTGTHTNTIEPTFLSDPP